MNTFLIVIALAAFGLLAFAIGASDGWQFWEPFRKKAAPYLVERVEELPDNLQPLKLYLAGSDQNLWAAAMICPCGCEDRIELNLLKAAKPCWTAIANTDGTATLKPSVWRQRGCGSHFFLRNGLIEWC